MDKQILHGLSAIISEQPKEFPLEEGVKLGSVSKYQLTHPPLGKLSPSVDNII